MLRIEISSYPAAYKNALWNCQRQLAHRLVKRMERSEAPNLEAALLSHALCPSPEHHMNCRYLMN